MHKNDDHLLISTSALRYIYDHSLIQIIKSNETRRSRSSRPPSKWSPCYKRTRRDADEKSAVKSKLSAVLIIVACYEEGRPGGSPLVISPCRNCTGDPRGRPAGCRLFQLANNPESSIKKFHRESKILPAGRQATNRKLSLLSCTSK